MFIRYDSKPESVKLKKKKILKDEPFNPINMERPDCLNAIFSQTFSDVEDIGILTEIKTVLAERITECSNYQTAPLLAPFIHLFALSSIRGSNAVKKIPEYQANQALKLDSVKLEDKKLKTILSIDANFIAIVAKESDARGAYTKKHTLFITVKNEEDLFKHYNAEVFEIVKSIDPTLASITPLTVFHEASHYAFFEVMENDCKPYKMDDFAMKDEFKRIFQNIKQVYQTWVGKTVEEAIAILSISNAFDYSKIKQPKELIVKVAEIIGFFGYEKGIKLLNKFVPELLKFYEEKFNPACMDYLVNNRVEEFIAVDPSFSDELQKHKQKMEIRNSTIRK